MSQLSGQSNLKVWSVYDRDFDVFTATHDECLRVNAATKADALTIGARVLRCEPSDLKAYEFVS